jgi:GntR family transcriptional regulator
MQIFLTGKKSIYEEIVDTIEQYIKLGALKEGEKLPSVRELALSLSINPNTVARAYDTLTQKGLVIALEKKGCFVAPRKSHPKNEQIKLLLTQALESGATIEEIRSALDEIEKERKS